MPFVRPEIIKMVRDYLLNHAAGPGNAVTIDRLAVLFQASRREIELVTEAIREEGLPLASSTSADQPSGRRMGLYIARNKEEFEPYARQLDHRIAKMSRRRKKQWQWLEEHTPQTALQTELAI